LSQIDLNKVIALLKEHTRAARNPLRITLLGGLALQWYGMEDRATIDLDAEVQGDLEGVFHFLKANNIPADLGEDISGWSVVAMPPGYRERAVEIYGDEWLRVAVLSPLDFVIAKLRRFTEKDLGDALFVARKHRLTAEEIEAAAEEVIRISPKDTALFAFRRNIKTFLSKLRKIS
jgi:hypothetical protein